MSKTCSRSKTLVWNGPFGAFETPPFDEGTNAVARTAARLTREGKLLSVAGGGDTGGRPQSSRRGGRFHLCLDRGRRVSRMARRQGTARRRRAGQWLNRDVSTTASLPRPARLAISPCRALALVRKKLLIGEPLDGDTHPWECPIMSMNATFIQLESAELSRLQGDPAFAEALFDETAADDGRVVLSLDKIWHGVHYILCGEPEPGTQLVSQAVMGGVELGEDEEGFAGYGPPRYFTAARVAELAEALNRPELELAASARFDASRMTQLGIYPGWEPSDASEVMDRFRDLRDFYRDAATSGRAVVTCLV